MLINCEESWFCIIDAQQNLLSKVIEKSSLIKNLRCLLQLARLMQIPVAFTEHYPHSVERKVLPELVSLIPHAALVRKTYFSAFCEPTFRENTAFQSRKQVIIGGLEAHICVLQTVFEMINAGKEVFVIVDAVSSATAQDKKYALKRMASYGAQLVTHEMVAFEWLRHSEAEQYQQVKQTLMD